MGYLCDLPDMIGGSKPRITTGEDYSDAILVFILMIVLKDKIRSDYDKY